MVHPEVSFAAFAEDLLTRARAFVVYLQVMEENKAD